MTALRFFYDEESSLNVQCSNLLPRQRDSTILRQRTMSTPLRETPSTSSCRPRLFRQIDYTYAHRVGIRRKRQPT